MHPRLAGVAFRLVIVRTVVRPPKGRSEGKDLGRFAAERDGDGENCDTTRAGVTLSSEQTDTAFPTFIWKILPAELGMDLEEG